MLWLEVSLVVVLTLINGFLAMSEMAIVSSRAPRLQALADRGSHGAVRALALSAEPGRFLSTVQIGITMVGVLSGAFSGATLGDRLSDVLSSAGLDSGWANFLGMGVVVTAITFLSLIVGELVPKQLALENAERIAAAVAPTMTWVARAASPLVWVLEHSGNTLLKVLGKRATSQPGVTEEELHSMVHQAESAGLIEPDERKMITQVMRLADRSVRSIMSPRFEVEVIDVSDTLDTVMAQLRESPRTRFPAHADDPDDIIGVVLARDLFLAAQRGAPIDLRTLVKPAPVVPESMDSLDAIETLRRSSLHMALVHDEYGHFVGVVTSSDVLSAIVGEFTTEEGDPEPAVVERDDGSLLISGWMRVEELGEQLKLTLPEAPAYQTAAGLIIDVAGRLPSVGEWVDFQGWRFEVVDLDGRRIDKILATRKPSVSGARSVPSTPSRERDPNATGGS